MKKLSIVILVLLFVSCKQDDKSLQKEDSAKHKTSITCNIETTKETNEVLDFFLKNKIGPLEHVKMVNYDSQYSNHKNIKKYIPMYLENSKYFHLNDYETIKYQTNNLKKEEKLPNRHSYKQIYLERFRTKYKVTNIHFLEKYEKVFGKIGFATVSKPLFSDNLRFAYIEISIWCGELCAEGSHYFLEKKDDKWVIIEKEVEWVS